MPELHGETLILDQEAVNAPVSMQEQTRSQIAIFNGPFGSVNALESTIATNTGIVALGRKWQDENYAHIIKVRKMRKHPTVKLVRILSIAAMTGAQWSVETKSDAPEIAKDIVSDLLPLQNHIMGSAHAGTFDWGWAPYEKVFYWSKKDQRTKLRKLKPLLQDYTRIMVDAKHGNFCGFRQFNNYLALSNSLLLNQDVEAGYLYGESTMAAIEPAYDRWLVCDSANVQYDRKVAGAHWVVHYPEGVSEVDGVITDNYLIAKAMLRDLASSGSIAVPSTVIAKTLDLNVQTGETAWTIELMACPPAQADFIARLGYLDTLMVRGGEFPERAILEGQYGTKAEAGEHADFAISRMDFRNKTIADSLNWHLVNQLLRYNCGQDAENSAWIKVAPIADDKKDLLKMVLQAAFSNQSVSNQMFAGIDLHAVREQLELPATDKDDEGDEHLSNMLQMLDQQHQDEMSQMQQQQAQQMPPGVPQQPVAATSA